MCGKVGDWKMSENLFFDKSKLKHCGKNVIIGKAVRIRAPEKTSIGDNVIIDDFTTITGEVTIGDYVHIGPGCVLAASSGSIIMEPLSGISAGSKIYAGSSSYVSCGLDMPTIPKEHQYNVIIENVILRSSSLVGANGIVLPGVELPEGFAMAANLIARKKIDFKPWHLLLDNDGKQIRRRGIKEYQSKVNSFYPLKFRYIDV
jgi:acetyltransferase-like isoleucine patch superfamily enzyme